VLDGSNDEYMARLGATLVALLQRCQAAEREGLLVEVMEIETALTTLRAELAVLTPRHRSAPPTYSSAEAGASGRGATAR
jgi:hypothetical protein